MRNCYFEPSQNPSFDWLNDCLNRVNIAFRWGKAAVISSHRLNFIGNIDVQNKDRNIVLFRNLLNEIVKKWPDVEFISSDELGKNIEGNCGI